MRADWESSRLQAVEDVNRRHRTALARLTNDALPPQTREDVLELAQTYHELLNEYIALQEAVGALVVG